jgi:2-octaprenyl-6-methoxyphenol hydroxylase
MKQVPLKQVDVLVCGGGMVGLPMGLALAQGGLKVAVVDALPPAATVQPQFDGRVSALSFAAVRMLNALSVWAHLAPYAQPISEILVSDGAVGRPASPFSLHFDSAEIGHDSLGHIAENRHIRAALHAVAAQQVNLHLIAPATVSSLTVQNGQVLGRFSDGEEFAASLAVAADGRDSQLRAQMGIGVIGWPYKQSGVVATVQMERPHGGVAYEHFLPSGPFAILPLTGNRASLVWTEKTGQAKALMAASPEAFQAYLDRRFGEFLGQATAQGPRFNYPLTLELAERMTGPRLALLGDAAHGVHPIAGQGLNLGLKDIAAMAQVLTDAARLGEDIGSPIVLDRYAAWRRFDNVMLAAATDGFVRLFSNDNPALRLARGVGMNLVNAVGPARRFFMQEAGGATGELPRLLRGEAL